MPIALGRRLGYQRDFAEVARKAIDAEVARKAIDIFTLLLFFVAFYHETVSTH